MKPIIGITMSRLAAGKANNRSPWATVPEPYIDAVREAGGIPVVIPNVREAAEMLAPHLAGIVLIGGPDMDPACYTDAPVHPTVYGIYPERDETESFLARHAVETARPLLGVCRGIQVLNVALGGTLIQDIPSEISAALPHSTPDGAAPLRHEVAVEPQSRLAEIVGGTRLDTNTFHHQAIAIPAPSLRVTARSDDGVIEAVELPGHPFYVGVQWHPELLAAEERPHANLFRALVRAASERG